MIDDIDRLQDAAERLDAQRPRPRVERRCIRCGAILAEATLTEDADAMECAGGCAVGAGLRPAPTINART